MTSSIWTSEFRPTGRPGFADRPLLDGSPAVVHVVPITSTVRGFDTEVQVEPDRFNGLSQSSAIQCHHVRAIAVSRVEERKGHVGPILLGQIREILGRILDIPE